VDPIVWTRNRASLSDGAGIPGGGPKTAFPHLKKKPYWGNHFWAPGYCVDTVGLNEEMIRKYVKFQEQKASALAKNEPLVLG
jgi:REP element-mobilizing transposase RayT